MLDLDADVLAVQEAPSADFELEGYTTHASARSHSEYSLILSRGEAHAITMPDGLPAAGACVDGVNVVAVHLAPGADGCKLRASQMGAVFDLLHDGPAVVLGDTNMRESEKPENGTRFGDVWKFAGSPRNIRFSWDSQCNRFYADSFTPGFKCRFDRAYTNIGFAMVRNMRLFANTPDELCGAFLSDHFGLVFTIPRL